MKGMTMQDTSYEAAWADDEEGAAPVENAVKKAAQEKRDAEAKEFADAFFSDTPAKPAVAADPAENAAAA